ncbi:NUDIX hydrolase [Maribacter sp. 2307ULW6-5]|uniref:NUDIX hydrolase n=1 Tax=Maribacter sp. 2307ULW6-5 TaxID=3386275 RepID=UPI0039BD8341
MDFELFEQRIPKIKNLPLPGQASHHKMAPKARLKEMARLERIKTNPKKAGVMALFYPNGQGQTHLLCILRKTYPGIHSNQVGLPGGKQEPADRDLAHTALRETHEEVGVPQEAVELVRSLSEIYIPPSNYQVHPFLGLYRRPGPFVRQESEVARILQVPLSDFLSDANVVKRKLSTSYAHEMEVPAFKLNGYIVWGATAMMLNEIKVMLKQVI